MLHYPEIEIKEVRVVSDRRSSKIENIEENYTILVSASTVMTPLLPDLPGH